MNLFKKLRKKKEWWLASPEAIQQARPLPRPATIMSDDPLDVFDDEASQ